MIEVAILVGRKIRKVYGKKQVAQEVLKGIDLEVNEGEFVGIMGQSGSSPVFLISASVFLDVPHAGL